MNETSPQVWPEGEVSWERDEGEDDATDDTSAS